MFGGLAKSPPPALATKSRRLNQLRSGNAITANEIIRVAGSRPSHRHRPVEQLNTEEAIRPTIQKHTTKELLSW